MMCADEAVMRFMTVGDALDNVCFVWVLWGVSELNDFQR